MMRHNHEPSTKRCRALACALSLPLCACGATSATPRMVGDEPPDARQMLDTERTAEMADEDAETQEVYEQAEEAEEVIARRDVADLGPDATLCTLLDSGMVTQLALFDGAVGLLVVTYDQAHRTDRLRRRADRFAQVTQSMAIAPSPELDQDVTARQALVGRTTNEPVRVPTAGSDLEAAASERRVPVTIHVQEAEGGVMLIFEPQRADHVGEVTGEIQRLIERVRRGECD